MSNNPIPGRPQISRHYFPRIPRLTDSYILDLYAKVDDSIDRVWGEKHTRETYRFLGIYKCDTQEIKPFPPNEDWENGLDPKTTWWYPNRWPVEPDFIAKVLIWLFTTIWLGIILRPMFWYKSFSRVLREWCISLDNSINSFFLKISARTKSTNKQPYPNFGRNLRISGKVNMFDMLNIPDKVVSILKYAIIAGACVLVVNHYYDNYKKEKVLKEQSAIATLQRANQGLQDALNQQQKDLNTDQAIWLSALEDKALAAQSASDLRQRKEELLREIESKFDTAIAEQEKKEIQDQLKQDEERMARIRAEIQDIQGNALGTVDYTLSTDSKTNLTEINGGGIKISATDLEVNITKAPATKATTTKTATTKVAKTTTKTTSTKTSTQLKREKEIAVSQVQIDYLWDVYNQAIKT